MDKDLRFIYEGLMVRQERTIKRLWILCIIMLFALLGTNAGWIWYESQFETVVTTETQQDVTQEADGGLNSFIGGDYYGEADDTDAN